MYNNTGVSRTGRVRLYIDGTSGTNAFDSGTLTISNNQLAQWWLEWNLHTNGNTNNYLKFRFSYVNIGVGVTGISPTFVQGMTNNLNIDITTSHTVDIATQLNTASASLNSAVTGRMFGPYN